MYTKFFNFSQIPFDVTPDPKFLFLTDSHQEALASMIYGIQQKKGFISITGEVGTGKTTLIHHLLSNLDPKVKLVFIFQTNVTFEELLKEILLELELPVGHLTRGSMMRELNNYLIERLAKNEKLAIIIDEAQNLRNEVLEDLRMLSNLETSQSKLIQIVFVGQPEFDAKLNSPSLRQLRQRIGIRRKIRPLTEEESRQYIEHRLKLVGSSTAKVFTPEAITFIAQYSGGIPRMINILCDNALLIGFGLSKGKIDEKIVQEVLNDMGFSIGPPTGPFRGGSSGIGDRPSTINQPAAVNPDPPPSIKRVQPPTISHESFAKSHTRGDHGPSAWRKKTYFLILGLLFLGLGIFLGREQLSKFLVGKIEIPAFLNSADVFPTPSNPSSEIKSENVPLTSPSSVVEQKVPSSEPLQPSVVASLNQTSLKPEERLKKTISVKEGDTIFAITRKFYGQINPTFVDQILELNPEIADLNLIMVGQKIKIPKITETSLIHQSPNGTFKIHLGTFPASEFAEQYKNNPNLMGKEIEVIPLKVSAQGKWYRIVAGPFTSAEESLRMIQVLKEKGLLPVFGRS